MKLSDIRGWSVFVEDPGKYSFFFSIDNLLIFFSFFCLVQMEAVYIPEEDRCTDILSLVEDEDNLRYF